MQTISINAVSAANEIANAIEGYSEGVIVEDRESGTRAIVRPGRSQTDLRFAGDGVESARVGIERPEIDVFGEFRGARVSHSSSSSRDESWRTAALTADVLRLATSVAKILDDWAIAGQLPRLDDERAQVTR